MGIRQITPSFNLLFILLIITFISEFENNQSSFPLFGPFSILACEIPQFFARSYRLRQLIILL